MRLQKISNGREGLLRRRQVIQPELEEGLTSFVSAASLPDELFAFRDPQTESNRGWIVSGQDGEGNVAAG